MFTITAGIGGVFVLFGKLFICILATLISYYIIEHVEGQNIISIWNPLLVVAVFSYLCGTMFMSVWGMGADTLL